MPARLIRLLPTLIGIATSAAVLVLDWTATERFFGTKTESLADRWPADWVDSPDEALRLAQERGTLVFVYAHADTFACRALERAAGGDALLRELLAGFVPLALDLDGGGHALALAHNFEIGSVPLLGVLPARRLEDRLTQPESCIGGIQDAILPITGGLHEPIGLAAELVRLATSSNLSTSDGHGLPAAPPSANDVLANVSLREARGDYRYARWSFDGGLTRETQPNGVLHRFALLRDAVRTHTVEGPADSEGTIEAALLVEDDERVLYQGWSMLASVFDLRAVAADERGTYRDVDARRWRRRVREASRKAWISCPDSAVVPFGSLLIERYGRSLDDLDSLDRMFCRAVVRTLQRTAPESPRVARAAEVVAAMK